MYHTSYFTFVSSIQFYREVLLGVKLYYSRGCIII